MSNYLVSLPPSVSPGSYIIGDGGFLVRVREEEDQKVHPQQLLACGYCMAIFTAREVLARHVVNCGAAKKKKKRHKGTEKSVKVFGTPSDERDQSSNEAICPRKGCAFKFTPPELERHLSCHVDGENTFACTECGAEFTKWRPLAAHLWKSHAVSVGLTSCPVCHKFKAVVPSALREHLLIHSDDRDDVTSAVAGKI